jgi:hypothetical protein
LPYDERALYSLNSIAENKIDEARSTDCLASLKIIYSLPGAKNMGKEHKIAKEEKKKPAMSPKEKKAAKKAKKAAKKG